MTGSSSELSHAYITAINIALQSRPYRFSKVLPFGVGDSLNDDKVQR